MRPLFHDLADDFVAFLILCAVWPALWRASLQFRLGNTSWRGLRMRFEGSMSGAYLACAPSYLPAMALIGGAALLGAFDLVDFTNRFFGASASPLCTSKLGGCFGSQPCAKPVASNEVSKAPLREARPSGAFHSASIRSLCCPAREGEQYERR